MDELGGGRMQIRLRPTWLAAVAAAGALLAGPGVPSASAAARPQLSALMTSAQHKVLPDAPVLPALAAADPPAAGGHPHGIDGHQETARPARQDVPQTGVDGMLVAAIGTVLTAGGWLLILAGGRRLRRRAGRRG